MRPGTAASWMEKEKKIWVTPFRLGLIYIYILESVLGKRNRGGEGRWIIEAPSLRSGAVVTGGGGSEGGRGGGRGASLSLNLPLGG